MMALLATAYEARAKMVYYEINGQRYSYSTNNRAQVKEARQRIDAANAAEAAKAKAQAERSANPLVAVPWVALRDYRAGPGRRPFIR